MSEATPHKTTPGNMGDMDWSKLSPLTLWRDWIIKSEAQWSEALSQLLKNPQASGMLTKSLDEARMAQRMFGEMAQASLAAANLPSRSDFESLDERMGRIEDALAALAAEGVALRGALAAAGAVAPQARPPRSRKPPRKDTDTRQG